jgi:hypothetical protein
LAITLGAVVVAAVWLVASAPKPSTSDFRNASAPSAIPKILGSPTVSPAPNDPCHVAGVTYCALNPAVTETTIRSTICVTGWTATIRPPESFTEPLKLQQMRTEGLSGGTSNYEEDHRMPLELGGAPRDGTNLSPESHSSSYAKDAAESAARRQVCDGADLRTVQAAFVADWLGPYPAYRST